MTGNDIREKFIKFFEGRGHVAIPSSSLLPENDPTVLFTTAGMHPLVPYLMGAPHPAGRRLVDVQKCMRTQDIEEVGDRRHTTFFEMLGVWSLGDYFKESIIPWTFEFFTVELGLPTDRIYVSVFAGDVSSAVDEESVALWKTCFLSVDMQATVADVATPDINDGHRIYLYPKKKNWWGPAGETGPCGPDTEVFFDTGRKHSSDYGAVCHPNCDCGRFVEIGNDVFMQFQKTAEGTLVPLSQKNVDVGWGLERLTAIVQGKTSVFETDLFSPIVQVIEDLSSKSYADGGEHARAIEVVADHVRAATFVIGDLRGVGPSNTDQGYVVRRLIRRAVRFGRSLGIEGTFTPLISEAVIALYRNEYPELELNRERVMSELRSEEEKFAATLERGLKEIKRLRSGDVVKLDFGSAPDTWKRYPDAVVMVGELLSGFQAFHFYETYGFPMELYEEEFVHKVYVSEWVTAMKAHQELSRAGAEQKFTGGLVDHSEISVRYHTATHLLHKALRIVLGDHVEQKGSNITHERMRFDFSHGQKMTVEEIKKVEDIVNEQVRKDLPVNFAMLTVDEAKASGAIGLFEDKYAALGNKVKVYMVGDEAQGYFSKEICGGPHVEHTGMVGTFKIAKEEASSAGVRRIKATVA